MYKIIFGWALIVGLTSFSFSSEPKSEYVIQEDGTVYKKREVILKANILLQDKNLEKRLLGARIISEISHFGPDVNYDVNRGYNSLVNSTDREIYLLGVSAIKTFINSLTVYSLNHLSMYFGSLFDVRMPGDNTNKWIELINDVANDRNLRLEAREFFADKLKLLQKQREFHGMDYIQYTMNMSLAKVKPIIDQEISKANALADKLLNNPS